MLKTSLEPLNTTDNQVDWEILDGNKYCSIDGSTGELTIDSSTITQMVKVRAKSRANANLYEDKEIVLTHRDVEGIEQLQFYTDAFFEDCRKLNIKRPDVVEPATNCIDQNDNNSSSNDGK